MGKGINCARQLVLKRKKFLRKIESPYSYRRYIANGSVLAKFNMEAKQPNSAQRKCVRVLLNKEKIKVSAFVPYCGTIEKIKLHDVVTIRAAGGSKGRSKGDFSGIRYEVIKINGVSVVALFKKIR